MQERALKHAVPNLFFSGGEDRISLLVEELRGEMSECVVGSLEQ